VTREAERDRTRFGEVSKFTFSLRKKKYLKKKFNFQNCCTLSRRTTFRFGLFQPTSIIEQNTQKTLNIEYIIEKKKPLTATRLSPNYV